MVEDKKMKSQSNVPSELRDSKYVSAKSLRKQLITKDSFLDDFSLRRATSEIRKTYAQGRIIK